MGTTGLTAIDYILADRWQIPPGAEAHYREQVLRMPDGYVCYDPPGDAPPVGPLPALAAGRVTFGCFNNLAKIGAAGRRGLGRHPPPRAAVAAGAEIQGDRRPRGRRRAWRRSSPAGGSTGSGWSAWDWSPHAELLAAYNQVDLALDPFPYCGGLTTCEALWMGVPVVTCPGETFAGRHSLSHLANVGLTETIARDFDEYVEIAASLAGDLPTAGRSAGPAT